MSESPEKTALMRAELDAMLASALFARSPLMQRLLTYLVDRKLSENGRTPKAYQVATEALGRSVDFDPATDSYPRVMVGRLRSMLDRYYADTAWVNRLRIPLGSYEIELEGRPGDEAAEAPAVPPLLTPQPTVPTEGGPSPVQADDGLPPNGRHPASAPAYPFTARLLIASLGLALLVLAVWVYSLQRKNEAAAFVMMPIVQVTPPDTGLSGASKALGRGIDAKLRDGLRRFEGIRLQSANPAGGSDTLSEADFRLDTSAIRTAAGGVEISFVLNRTVDQQAIWSDHVSIPSQELPSFDRIDPVIAQVAGDYGVIVHDQLDREPGNFAAGYPCFAQYNAVRNTRDPDTERRVMECLRASVAKAPTNPVFLNAYSLAILAKGRQLTDPARRRAELAEAAALAQRAYDNGRTTSAGLSAIARMHFYANECAESEMFGRAAIALNPYDADMIGAIGQFSLACKHPKVGEAQLRRSIALDSSHGSVPTVTLAFLLADSGDNAGAQALLDRLPTLARADPQFLLAQAIVMARRGDMTGARDRWRRLVALARLPSGTPPEKVLGRFIISDPVIVRATRTVKQLGIVGMPTR